MKIGLQKQLPVDDYVIARMQNVTRELGTVTKANDGNPIMLAEKHWERKRGGFALYLSTIYDQGKFRMWYFAESLLVAYAGSADGAVLSEGVVLKDVDGFPDYHTEPVMMYANG